MEFTVRQIAEMVNGTVEGNPDIQISHLSKIEEGSEGSLSFLANPLYTNYIYSTRASAVLVNEDFIPTQPLCCTLIRVENSYFSFAGLLEKFASGNTIRREVSSLCSISPASKIGTDNYIGEFVTIGDEVTIGNHVMIYPGCYIGPGSRIGDDTILYAGVKIYHDTIIGKNCTIHAGVVLGSDGFGFAPQSDNVYKKIVQIGNVVIEDNVEIGSNTTIDRATLGSTIIRKGAKLDNLIQIAHNVEIGENTVIAAQTGIAGSTKIGKNCMIGGQVGIVGHLSIGDNVKIGAQSGIEHNIKDGEMFLGTPALEGGKARRLYVHWRNFDQLVKKVYELEKTLKKSNPS
jgi:UDP-3-O-[3-hydroxymyristoyl] glucosamine N-acyltransferase